MNIAKTLFAASLGVAATVVSASAGFVEVTTNITTDTRWTRDNVYILRTTIFVLPPAKLTIEPGTIIRGIGDTDFGEVDDDRPGALIVSRGAKIIANGTPDDPIVFTSWDDPYVIGGTSTIPSTINSISTSGSSRNYAPDGPTSQNGMAYDGLWGGLVILGEGPLGYDGDADGSHLNYNPITNTYSGDTIHYPDGVSPLASPPFGFDVKDGNGVGVCIVEGLNISTVSGVTYTEPFPEADNEPATGEVIPGVYGGKNRSDNNGVLRFVSSRYGGFKLGSDNELNGISFGGTGSGFVAEWLESYNNADDGFEFFGGYTNFRYLFSLFQGDDGMDGDNGFNGTIQFAFVICDNSTQPRSGFPSNNTTTGRITANNGEHCTEWDGAVATDETGTLVTPNTVPYVYNFSAIPGKASGRDALRNRRGTGGNWYNGLVQDSVDQAWQTGGTVNGLTQNFMVYSSVTAGSTELGAIKYSNTNGTALASEMISVTRTAKNGIDPRLASGAASADVTKFRTPVNRGGDFPYSGWTKVPFAGAMRDSNMLKGWTILDYLDQLASATVARPVVTLGVSGSNPTVAFQSSTGVGGRTVLYVVERSTNRKVWTPIAVVSDNNGAGTTDFDGATFATSDAEGASGTIRITDTATTLTADTPVHYRVIPL